MRCYDAHNHLQDERFGGRQEELVTICQREGIARMVVNGSCEEDWPRVAELARRYPDLIVPSFGYHPWYVAERTDDWQKELLGLIEATPGAGIGEIGLDRWKEGLDLPAQEDAFAWQWRLAAALDRPVSVHCLRAWGRLHELLRTEPRPRRGFLLHSYGGPKEMIEPLAQLGAYFSFPGYFAHERKVRQRETFRHVPPERLLIETDAPDQVPPEGLIQHPLTDASTGQALNHPANLPAVCRFAADMLGEPVEVLAARVEENFARLFGNAKLGRAATG